MFIILITNFILSGSVLEIEFHFLHHAVDFIPFVHEEEFEYAFKDMVFDVGHTQASAKLGVNCVELSLVLIRRCKLHIFVPFIFLAFTDPPHQPFSFQVLDLSGLYLKCLQSFNSRFDHIWLISTGQFISLFNGDVVVGADEFVFLADVLHQKEEIPLVLVVDAVFFNYFPV